MAEERAYKALASLRLDRALGRLPPEWCARMQGVCPNVPPATLWALDEDQVTELQVVHALGMLTPEEVTAVELSTPGWTWRSADAHMEAWKAWVAADPAARAGRPPPDSAMHDGLAVGFFMNTAMRIARGEC
jgi:hypothetical protein